MKVSYMICDNENCGKKMNEDECVTMYLDSKQYDLCRRCANKIKDMLKSVTKERTQEIKGSTVDKKSEISDELGVHEKQTEIKKEEAEVENQQDSTDDALEDKSEIENGKSSAVEEEADTEVEETDTGKVEGKQYKCLAVTDKSKDIQQSVAEYSKNNSDGTQKTKKEIVIDIIKAGGNYVDISRELSVSIGTAKTYYYTHRRKVLDIKSNLTGASTVKKKEDTQEVKEATAEQTEETKEQTEKVEDRTSDKKTVTPEQMKGLDELMEDKFDIEYGMLSREQLKALAEVECTGVVGTDCRNCFYRDRKLNTCYYIVVTNKSNKVTRGSSCEHYINRKYKEEN